MSTQQESETHRFSSFGTIKNIIFIKGFHWRGIIASLLMSFSYCQFFTTAKFHLNFKTKVLGRRKKPRNLPKNVLTVEIILISSGTVFELINFGAQAIRREF